MAGRDADRTAGQQHPSATCCPEVVAEEIERHEALRRARATAWRAHVWTAQAWRAGHDRMAVPVPGIAARYISRNRGFGRGTSEFYPTVIKIAFTDEISTVVHVERSLDGESKRQRWEAFVTAARQAAT